MADLPPNIGFDDEPVILLNYVTIEDSAPSASRPLIMSKSRNRVKSDSSLVSSSGTVGKKRGNKSSVSSLSDASSFDQNESDKMNTPFHSTQSQDSDMSPCHIVQSRSSPLKRLQQDNRLCLKSLDEVDSVGGHVPPDNERERGRRKKGFSVVVEPKRSPSTDTMSVLLIERDREITDLRRQIKELQTAHQSSDVPLISVSHVPLHQRCISETSEPPFILAESSAGSQRSTLERLLEEQHVSYRLKTDNSELRSKVLILEGEVDSLRQQNLVQLQQLEQATNSLAAASNSSHSPSSASPQKTKKKSFFGLRRSSGRKTNLGNKNGSGSSIEQSPRLKRPGFHSASNLSLEGSLSEHDISSLLTRKSEGRTDELHPLGGANFDFERLQMMLKLTMEEKSELGRQLELLREELRHQEEKREGLLKETINKDKYMESSVKLQETLQALQLTTREKELLESEGEGLKYELETLRSERDSLTASLKGKEVKAVLKEKQEMDFLRSENKALMSEVRTLISNSDGLETSLSQLKREMVARDVRGHELKLKIKKLEKENVELRAMVSSLKESNDDNDKSKDVVNNKVTRNLLSTKRHTSPEKQTFTSSSSSFSDQQSPSTGQPPMKPHHRKPSPFLSASTGESKFSAHERTQSEDLTSSAVSVPPLQMVRTSSGGTKFVAVQVTLPTKENATKVKDKSLSVPLLEEPTNSISKRKTSDSTLGTFVSVASSGGNGNNGKPGVNSLVKMFESGKGEGEKGGRGSLMSGSLMESSLEESLEEKEAVIVTENRSDSVSSTTPSLKKTRKLSSSSSLKEQERAKKVEEEEARQAKRKEDERKKKEIEAKKREEAKEKQRKEEEARERQKREQEARERERREEQLRKEEEKKRKELEAKEKERREREKKEKEERERREREAKEQREREKKKEEEERQRKEKEIKEQERRKKEEQQRKRDEITADRSQTWPPKADNVTTTSTNTLPSTGSHRTDPKSPASPVHSSPLLINKPKPPPTIMGVAGRSKTHSVLLSPTQTADSSLTGVVANLRSSWEKKSQMGVAPAPPTSHPRLSKAPSVPVSYPRMERTSSLNVPVPPSAHLAPPPFAKTGSGPAGTIISSPSNQNKTTLGLKRVGHASSEATPSNPAHTQNGHVILRSMSPIDRSSTDPAAGEVVLRSNASPRLNRPASLYVSSPTQSPPISFGTPTSEKRLSSLITKLQVKDTSATPTATPSPSFVQNQSPILPPRNVGVANNKSGPPPMTRPHSFYAGSSPKPLQRAASLASPLDRRTKKNMLIRWCQIKTQEYHNVNISNFGESFSNGLAFCALLHHFVPERVPYHNLDGVNQKRNFELAFSVAEELGIPSLLDVDDMVEMAIPDWMSVMTYVSYIYNHFSKKEQQS